MPSRLSHGDVVGIAGTYVLVNRYGKSLDVAMQREVGERLPIAVAAEGPIRYVLVGSTETAHAT
jgi:hypothetical protein